MPDLTQSIAQHPFWTGMNPGLLSHLGDAAEQVQFSAGETIFKERSTADQFYLIESGRVALETNVPGRGMTTVQTLREGDALGWSWFFPPHQWHFGARAIDDTATIALDASTLRERAQSAPEFGYELAYRIGEIMLQRLQAARLQLMDFYNVPE